MHKMGVTVIAVGKISAIISVHMHKMSLTGSAVLHEPGSGSIAMKKMGLFANSGSIAMKKMGLFANSGSVALNKMILSSSGTAQDHITGSVHMHKMGLSGSGTGRESGSAHVVIRKMGLHCIASIRIPDTGTGSIRIYKMSLTGSGVQLGRYILEPQTGKAWFGAYAGRNAHHQHMVWGCS